MNVKPFTLIRFGAWAQLGTLALAVGCWRFGLPTGVVASCVASLGVTVVGIVGIARSEGAAGFEGLLVYPFLVPGLVPLYYVATRSAHKS